MLGSNSGNPSRQIANRRVPTLIAGTKLLLADDSIAIQKVVDLTFTDEGMEVTTVGDGQDALEKLDQIKPDVVLADVFMPGVDGYELCRFIKESERFRGVPVMLLVGSFEPFDEAEARRAGADDVVRKPFQSIRDLVSRVGLLVRQDRAQSEATQDASALSADEPADVKVFVETSSTEPDTPTVLVEAPMMELEPPATPEHECPPVIELQTADTKRLEPISDAAPAQVKDEEFQEAIELQVVEEYIPAEPSVVSAPEPCVSAQPGFDDEGVLDLGDIDSFSTAGSEDDFELDIEVEPVGVSAAAGVSEFEVSAADEFAADSRSSAPDKPHEVPAILAPEEGMAGLLSVQNSVAANNSDLSPDAIDQISRRVVEQLSDKVVREIAWEVVPELSELLIKRRMEEQR